MAEIKNKKSDDRVKLEEVLPLETPLEVQVAVSSLCNFRCIYCPIPREAYRKGIMTMATFQKIVDDIGDFPKKIKTLRLVREGEPLLNKKLPDMVRYAKSKQPTVIVDTVTNASLLTNKLSDELISAGLDKLYVSFQGITDVAYKTVSLTNVTAQQVIDNVMYFATHRGSCKLFVKVPDIGVTQRELELFYSMFDKEADEVFMEYINPAWPNFDVSHLQKDPNMGYYGKPKWTFSVIVCTLPFYNLSIDYKGTVTSCSVDWEEHTNFGNVNEKSLYDIWNGKKFNEFRKIHLRGDRWTIRPCDKCIALEYCEPDLIDDYREEILKRYEEKEKANSENAA